MILQILKRTTAQKAVKFLKRQGVSFEKAQDGTILVKGDLQIKKESVTGGKLPDLSMLKVTGNFNCSGLGLTTLQGMPREVLGDVDCHFNKLDTLEGCPPNIGGSLDCSSNQLTSLKGAPAVGGDFICRTNRLTSLEGVQQHIPGDFDCSENKLQSLAGGPQTVGRHFLCNNTPLASLEGGPQSVGGNYYCYENKLTSLKGAPSSITETFNCEINPLVSLEGSPRSVRHFICKHISTKPSAKFFTGAPERFDSFEYGSGHSRNVRFNNPEDIAAYIPTIPAELERYAAGRTEDKWIEEQIENMHAAERKRGDQARQGVSEKPLPKDHASVTTAFVPAMPENSWVQTVVITDPAPPKKNR